MILKVLREDIIPVIPDMGTRMLEEVKCSPCDPTVLISDECENR